MKQGFYILLAFLYIFSMGMAIAQDDKALEKEWSKKMKDLKPLDYKALVEERDALKKTASESEAAKASLQADIDSKKTEIEKLKAQLEHAQKTPSGGSEQAATAASTKTPAKGVVFKVQVGNFKNKDLSKYFENNSNFSGEIDEDGTKKYTLGVFNNYWEADKFKKYMREMGVKDAWIVSYKDGKRIAIKDALEGSL